MVWILQERTTSSLLLDSGLLELPDLHLAVLEEVCFRKSSFRKAAAGIGRDAMRVYRTLKQVVEIMHRRGGECRKRRGQGLDVNYGASSVVQGST